MTKKRLLVYENKYYKKFINQEYLIKYLGAWCYDSLGQINEDNNSSDYWNNTTFLVSDIEFSKNLSLRILNSAYLVIQRDKNLSINLEEFTNLYYSWTVYTILKVLSNWRLFDESDNFDTTYIFDIKFEEVITRNLEDVNKTYYYPKWNNYVISEIIKFRKIEHFIVHFEDGKTFKKNSIIKSSLLKFKNRLIFFQHFFKFKFKFKNWIFYYFTQPVNLFPDYQKNDSITKYVQLIYSKFKCKIESLQLDSKKRGSHNLDFTPLNDFEFFFSNIYFKLLPVSLLEGLETIESFSINKFIGGKPDLLIYSDFLNNELLLHFLKNFTKNQIYVFQHGGGFGFNNYNVTEIIEKYYCTKYLTWGWKNSEQDLQFISPRFNSLFKINSKKSRNGICFILYDSPPYIPVFQPTIYSYKFINYLKLLHKFFIETKFKRNITIRLYPRNDSGIDLKNIFQNNIMFDKSKCLNTLYSKYELYVYTYNSTGFLELWTLKIPCLLLIENDNLFVDKFGINQIETLKNNNILFTNSETLENFLNQNFDKIYDWWTSSIIQNSISKFMETYASDNTKNISKNDLLELKNIFNI
jgi:putative transferase (TIGR04331 family)